MKKFFALLFFALSFGICFCAIPEKPIGYLSDFAHVLNDPQSGQLNAYLAQYEQATSNEIAVVVIPSLEGLPIEDYSIQLAEKWKVGKKGKDNGVLFLIAVNDHKMRIEVGYGLEGKLTDAASGAIIRDVVAPYFRQNQYAEGIYAGLRAITEKIDGKPFEGTGAVPQATGNSSGGRAIVTFLILLFIWLFIFRRLGFWGIPLLLSSGRGWGSGSDGGGWGSDGGGGFSGGGGSFGGGGASGGW